MIHCVPGVRHSCLSVSVVMLEWALYGVVYTASHLALICVGNDGCCASRRSKSTLYTSSLSDGAAIGNSYSDLELQVLHITYFRHTFWSHSPLEWREAPEFASATVPACPWTSRGAQRRESQIFAYLLHPRLDGCYNVCDLAWAN